MVDVYDKAITHVPYFFTGLTNPNMCIGSRLAAIAMLLFWGHNDIALNLQL